MVQEATALVTKPAFASILCYAFEKQEAKVAQSVCFCYLSCMPVLRIKHCLVRHTIKNTFMEDLDNLLGGSFEEFSALNNFERTGFVLGCENWERYDFKALLRLVQSFILFIWYTRKNKLYGDQDGNGETSGCSCSCRRSFKLRLRIWVHGRWRKRYGSNMSILLLSSNEGTLVIAGFYSCTCTF